MAHHGDITEITFNHPTLGDGRFFAKANEGNTYDPGGIRTSDDQNAIASNGDPIFMSNRVRGYFEVMIENDQNIRDDADLIARLQASPDSATWTFSVINGTVFRGSGKPVGDVQPDINAGTMTLKVSGAGFTKI